MLSDKITIDPQTKLRMEIRKEAMSNNGSGARPSGNSNSNGGDKWARSPDHAARSQDSPYRRAYEEAQNRSFSSRSSGGNNNSANRRQQQPSQSQDGRRAGRYYDANNSSKGSTQGQQQQQHKQSPPSSFATSSGFGFSAPASAARAKVATPPSSFATSSGFGFGAPKPSAAPAIRPAAQKPAPKTTSQLAAQPIIKKEAVSAPAGNATASPAPTSTTVAKPAHAPAPAPTPAPAAHTFVKSTRTAKENAKRQVEQRSRQRRQRQKPAKDVFIPEAINVSNLAGLLGARMGHFENTMKAMGMEITRHDHSKSRNSGNSGVELHRSLSVVRL